MVRRGMCGSAAQFFINLSWQPVGDTSNVPAGLSPRSRARELGRASASAAGNKRAAPLRTPLDTPDAAEPAAKGKARLRNEDASGILPNDDVHASFDRCLTDQ